MSIMTKDTSAQAIKFYNKIKTICTWFKIKVQSKNSWQRLYNFEQVMRVKTCLAE